MAAQAWEPGPWMGCWGDDAPYHHPVFVLTHHTHDRVEMEGGTTFHCGSHVDELLTSLVPVFLGSGTRLFENLGADPRRP